MNTAAPNDLARLSSFLFTHQCQLTADEWSSVFICTRENEKNSCVAVAL